MDLTDLVHTKLRCAEQCFGGDDGNGTQEEGRDGAQGCTTESHECGQGLLGVQYCDRDQFNVSYPVEGQSNSWHLGRSATLGSGVGNPLRDGYQGTTTGYKIENGKVVTTISPAPFAETIYKLGDTYYGAPSIEFGYANYEIIPTPQIVINPLNAMVNQFAIELD